MGIRKELEREFDYDIVEEFLDHFDIMTETMEPAIIALESGGQKERVDELFRLFHNIKSATGFLKLERIHLLAELAEEVMERLRSGAMEVKPEVVDWLLLVSDQMRRWYLDIGNDETLSPTDPSLLKIPE